MFLTLIAAVNLFYGFCEADGSNFSYAPQSLTIGNRWTLSPSSNEYANANWWPVTDIAPSVATNEIAIPSGWIRHEYDNTREEIEWAHNLPPETNEWGEIIWFPITNVVHFSTYSIERTYNIGLKPIPQPIPRKFSKLKLYGTIAQLGAWDKIQTWLEGKTINNMNGWLAFQLAQEISEDHPMFKSMAGEAQEILGLDDATFNTLLNACILED